MQFVVAVLNCLVSHKETNMLELYDQGNENLLWHHWPELSLRVYILILYCNKKFVDCIFIFTQFLFKFIPYLLVTAHNLLTVFLHSFLSFAMASLCILFIRSNGHIFVAHLLTNNGNKWVYSLNQLTNDFNF